MEIPMTTTLKVGFEYPGTAATTASMMEIEHLWMNIDPQHGGHKSPYGDAPVTGDCAASWTLRNWEALHDGFAKNCCPKIGDFASPKWDVDALVSATIVAEVIYALYMGTGSQHFFCWGEGSDGKLKERVELVRRLDSGELGQQLGDHPELIGLARVASSGDHVEYKIELCRGWLTGVPSQELTQQAALAQSEVDDGLSDAVVTDLGARALFIVTKTLGKPSRGRSVAQKLGFDRGLQTVIQMSADWTFPDGSIGPKYTITHKGLADQSAIVRALNPVELRPASGTKWGGPTPRPDSWILGSPMDRPSSIPPGVVIRAVMAALGEAAAKSYLQAKGEGALLDLGWFASHWVGVGVANARYRPIGQTEYLQGAFAFLSKPRAVLFMCFCGWEGIPVVDEREIVAREMDVNRESQAPDRDDSDRLANAVDSLAAAVSGRCPKCSSAKLMKFS
jgi:hypothetical protein